MTRESSNVVSKRSWRDEYLKWICGFANAQGGVLEIGRDDRGDVVGVEGVLRLLEDIPSKVQSLLGIVVDINLKSESGREYIQIVVQPHPNPISYKGEFHYRSGSTKRILVGGALNRFLLERHGRTWDDVALPTIRLGDLDDRILDRFRRRGVASGRPSRRALKESDERLVENLNLRDGSHLKRAAALLFHRMPHRLFPEAHLKIGAFRGSELLFQDVVEGDLFSQVDLAVDLLYTKYTRGLVSYDGNYRVETFPVPREAMREAVINAVIHRDYSAPTPIQVRVSDERISIWNPAQLGPEWFAQHLDDELASRPHNPRIAYAFFRAGMIEAWGRGIRRIVDLCARAGNPVPTWRLEAGGTGLWVRSPFSNAYRADDADARGISLSVAAAAGSPTGAADILPSKPGTTPITAPKTEATPPKPAVERILESLRAEPGLTRTALATRVGLTPDGVKYHIRNLKAAGVLRRVGSHRAGHWEVLR